MPFDSAQPANNSPLVSQVMRNQFNALKALIDAINAIVAAQIDGVSTLNPGDPATATVWFAGNALHFSFAIPRGNDGAQGIPGDIGLPGMQGPPFAQALVNAVNTLAPGSAATVGVSFDGTNVHLTFGIPAGAAGADGEVTNAALAAAIAGTSNNSNAVATLDTPFADPDAESLRQKLNELILAQRR